MLFSPYISKLLLNYDCVIIPDFGGFVANYAAAKIHPTQHTFEPPFKQVAFNINLTGNDGLLANAVATGEAISFEQACKRIEEEVLRIQIRLAKKEKVELSSIGTLYYDIERNLQFKPANTDNFLLDSFGLSSFQSPAIKRENFSERFEKQFKDRPALPFPAQTARKRKLWPMLLVLPILAAVLLIPYQTNFISNLKLNYSHLLPFSATENTKYVERAEIVDLHFPVQKTSISLLTSSNEPIVYLSLSVDNSKTIPVKMEVAASDTTNVSSTILVKATPHMHHTYYLIAGCFKEKENADALVNELKRKGYAASLVGQNASGLYRVSYHQFTDRISASAAKSELQLENPDVWVFQN